MDIYNFQAHAFIMAIVQQGNSRKKHYNNLIHKAFKLNKKEKRQTS